MDYVKTITSEAEVKEQFVNELKRRKETNQNAFYLNKGAELFYGARSFANNLADHYWPFFYKNIPDKNKKIAYISMGCGNGVREKEALKAMYEAGYQFTFFGVDSSVAALELVRQEYVDFEFPKQYLCADFGSPRFREEILDLTKDYDVRVYAFFGGTIGNIEPDYVADIMADMMKPGDYLWIDVYTRRGKTSLDDRKLYELYRDYLDQEAQQDFIFYPSSELGIPRKSGNLFVEMTTKEDLDALLFTIKFAITEKVKVKYRNQRITLLPGNELSLIKILNFDPNGLVKFFEERDFAYVDMEVIDGGGQFMFEYSGAK